MKKKFGQKHKKILKTKKNKTKKGDNRDVISGINRDFNNIYTTWWLGKEENYYGAGIGLTIRKQIAQRVYAINKIKGHAIMADLHFKNKICPELAWWFSSEGSPELYPRDT